MTEKFQKIAAHGFIKKGNKYLITRRSFTDDYKPGEWDLPGGTIEFGEDPVAALKREVLEETNLKIKVGKVLSVYSFLSNPVRYQFQIVYECEYKSGKIKLNPEDHDQFVLATVSEIKKLKKIAFLDNFYREIILKKS